MFALPFRSALPPFFSKANGRIATIASRMSEARSEREISLWVYEYNRTCDENRGISKPDFLRHFWEEEKIRRLSGNVQGPSPGGNLMIPPEVTRPTTCRSNVSRTRPGSKHESHCFAHPSSFPLLYPVPRASLTRRQINEEDMELMGFEYLDVDQDKVAMEIANKYKMDWPALSTSSLPAVSEDPLPGMSVGCEMPVYIGR